MVVGIGIGSSHLYAIQSAYERVEDAKRDRQMSLGFLQLREEKYKPHFAARDGVYHLNENIHAKIDELIGLLHPTTVFTCVGGGIQHEIGLAVHPRPFDFELPSHSSLGIDESAELLPYTLVKDTLSRLNRPFFTILKLLREHLSLPMVQLCPPPPIKDTKLIAQLLAKTRAELQISPASLRYKLWAVHAETVADFCDENQMSFVAPPPSTLDDEGYLKEAFVSNDAIHGNAAYGEEFLTQLQTLTVGDTGHASV